MGVAPYQVCEAVLASPFLSHEDTTARRPRRTPFVLPVAGRGTPLDILSPSAVGELRSPARPSKPSPLNKLPLVKVFEPDGQDKKCDTHLGLHGPTQVAGTLTLLVGLGKGL